MTEQLPRFIGLGLFTGRPGSVSVRPGARGMGLMIHPLARSTLFEASFQAVTRDAAWAGLSAGVPVRNTTLCEPADDTAAAVAGVGTRAIVATVEHLLSALAGLGIWDAIIEITGSEVPILDGSAKDFAERLAPWPTRPPLSPVVLTRRVEVRDDKTGASIVATPARADFRSYTYHLDYGPGAPIPPQSCRWDGSRDAYLAEIAPARTFSLEDEANAARALGLFRAFTPRDLIVVGKDGRPIDNEWRFPDEPARHKLLDLIGDLALLGGPLYADVVATKAGHALTQTFCEAVALSVRGVSQIG